MGESETGVRDRPLVEAKEKMLRKIYDDLNELDAIFDNKNIQSLPEITEGVDGQLKPESKMKKKSFKGKMLFLTSLLAVTGLISCIPFQYVVNSAGELLPVKRTIIKAPYNGELIKIYFKTGELFKQGDIIAEFKHDHLLVNLTKKQEENQIIQEQIKLLEAGKTRIKKTLQTHQQLFDQKMVILQKLENAHFNYDYIRLKYEETRQQLIKNEIDIEQLQYLIQQAIVIAPYTGMIVTYNIHLKEGERFESGQKICEIVDNRKWVIETTIKEDQISKVQPGQLAFVKLTAHKKCLKGKVITIGEYSGRATLTLKELVNVEHRFQNGIIVKIQLLENPEIVKYGLGGKIKIHVGQFNLFYHVAQWLAW